LKQAALIEPASTALAGLKKISITPEKTIAIIGTGPIGLAAIPFAKAFGASKVIMIGRRDDKLQIAKKLGADVCININREDLYTSFDKATNNIGADLVLETSGAQETINHCIKIAARKGTIALIGFYETDSLPLNIDPLVFKELSLTGVMGEFGLIEETANMISNKNIDLSPLITNVFTFDEASNAIMEAKSFNERVKSLVHINQDLI
jgi:L-iditol 2-dehydrogenase